MMADTCTHPNSSEDVTSTALPCEECLKIGSTLLRRSGGHVGCCDQSPHRRASAHFRSTGLRPSKAMIRQMAGAGVLWTRRSSNSPVLFRRAARHRASPDRIV